MTKLTPRLHLGTFLIWFTICVQISSCKSTQSTTSGSSDTSSVREPTQSQPSDAREAVEILNGGGRKPLNGLNSGDRFVLSHAMTPKLMQPVLDQSRHKWRQVEDTCKSEIDHLIEIVGFSRSAKDALVLYHAPQEVAEESCQDGSYFFVSLSDLEQMEKCRKILPTSKCKIP